MHDALADFAQYCGRLELDTTEMARQQVTPITEGTPTLAKQLADSLGMTEAEAEVLGVGGLARDIDQGKRQFDAFLQREQESLVEAMVRAYARRRLRPLLEEFEVLEVEREGEWELARWGELSRWDELACWGDAMGRGHVLIFMSRPDALLRSRADNSLYILSFKTAAQWDVRKERDAQHDMQGLSEGIEVERRLAGWWQEHQAYGPALDRWAEATGTTVAMARYLAGLPAPPRILGIRMEFLLKGERWKDKDLTQKFGFESRHQRSALVRGYLNTTGKMSAGDPGQWAWAWDFTKPDGSGGSLNYRTWKSQPIWEHMSVKEWIDRLDRSEDWQPGAGDALASVFIPPIPVYRNEDDLRDLVETMEAEEVGVVEAVEEVAAARNEGERRSVLNRRFGLSRQACEYPSTCAFVKVCFGPQYMRADPVASGHYQPRTPHHQPEVEAFGRERS